MKEALKLALEALESSRIFVTSREKIKHPEGTDWYDERIAAIKEALAQPERTWIGLTESDRRLINFQWQDGNGTVTEIIDLVESKLEEKNK